MKRSFIASLFALPVLTFALAAGAEESKPAHHEPPQFPVPAATFQAHHDARVVKMRAKLEARIVEKKVEAEKAKEMRARFDARTAKVQAAIAKATADGTVTKAEADEIRAVAKEGHHEGRHAHRGGERHPHGKEAPKRG